jgi:hypothetical protein
MILTVLHLYLSAAHRGMRTELMPAKACFSDLELAQLLCV